MSPQLVLYPKYIRGDGWAAEEDGGRASLKSSTLGILPWILSILHHSVPLVPYTVLPFSICSLSEHVDKDYVCCWRIRADKGRGGWEPELEHLGQLWLMADGCCCPKNFLVWCSRNCVALEPEVIFLIFTGLIGEMISCFHFYFVVCYWSWTIIIFFIEV